MLRTAPWTRTACAACAKTSYRQVVVRDGAAMRHVERSVSPRIPHLQRLDADPLRRYADPDIAGAHPVVVRLQPVDVEIVAGRHVVPLDDGGAVERRWPPRAGARSAASDTGWSLSTRRRSHPAAWCTCSRSLPRRTLPRRSRASREVVNGRGVRIVVRASPSGTVAAIGPVTVGGEPKPHRWARARSSAAQSPRGLRRFRRSRHGACWCSLPAGFIPSETGGNEANSAGSTRWVTAFPSTHPARFSPFAARLGALPPGILRWSPAASS